jgi:hypothetical protein
MFMFQPKTTAAVAFTLAFTFASRCLWNFLTYADVVVVEIGFVVQLRNHVTMGGRAPMPSGLQR